MSRRLVDDRCAHPHLEAELAALPAEEREALEMRARAELVRDHAAIGERLRRERRAAPTAEGDDAPDELEASGPATPRPASSASGLDKETIELCVKARAYVLLEEAHPEIVPRVLAGVERDRLARMAEREERRRRAGKRAAQPTPRELGDHE